MKRYVIAAMVVVATSAVHAADSPIGQLLGSLKTLVNGPQSSAPAEAPASAAIAGDVAPDEIVRRMAASAGGAASWACGPSSFAQRQIEKATSQFQMGQWAMASASAYVTAQNIARCVTSGGAVASPGDKNTIGNLLAISAIAMQRGDMNTAGDSQSDAATRAQYALTLLSLDAQANRDRIEQLQHSDIFPEKVAMASGTADLKLTANEAVGQFQQNQMAFDAKYYGKTLQVTGKLLSVNGSGSTALLILEGIAKPVDVRGLKDSAYCKVSNSAAIADVLKVKVGAKVTVRGVLMRKQFVDTGVSLSDCSVVL